MVDQTIKTKRIRSKMHKKHNQTLISP